MHVLLSFNILSRATYPGAPSYDGVRTYTLSSAGTKGLTDLVSSRPGARAALRRPRPAGTQQYVKGTMGVFLNHF